MKILILIISLLTTLTFKVRSQTCPDGFPAVFKCVQSKSPNNDYVCKGDPKLGCEFINGVSYCCKEDSENHAAEAAGSPNSTDPSVEYTSSLSSTDSQPRSGKEQSSTEKSQEHADRSKGRSCRDRGSDCPRLSNLCTNPAYESLMRDECPVTCRHCDRPVRRGGGQKGKKKEKTKQNGREDEEKCADRGPDCARLPHLCNHSVYASFMAQECPITCGVKC